MTHCPGILERIFPTRKVFKIRDLILVHYCHLILGFNSFLASCPNHILYNKGSSSDSCLAFSCDLFSLLLSRTVSPSFLGFHEVDTFEENRPVCVMFLHAQIQIMHLWQEYHRSHAVFLVQPIRWHMIYLIIYFDYFMIVASAWLLHFKVAFFPFEINQFFCILKLNGPFLTNVSIYLFTSVISLSGFNHCCHYLLLQLIYSHILASDNLLKLDLLSF